MAKRCLLGFRHERASLLDFSTMMHAYVSIPSLVAWLSSFVIIISSFILRFKIISRHSAGNYYNKLWFLKG